MFVPKRLAGECTSLRDNGRIFGLSWSGVARVPRNLLSELLEALLYRDVQTVMAQDLPVAGEFGLGIPAGLIQ